jgi:hypothetical protein
MGQGCARTELENCTRCEAFAGPRRSRPQSNRWVGCIPACAIQFAHVGLGRSLQSRDLVEPNPTVLRLSQFV